jgi:hypothetical protein
LGVLPAKVVAGWVSLFSENISGFHYTGWQCFDVSNTLICIVGSDKSIVLMPLTIITDNVSMTTIHVTTAFVIGNYKQCVLVSTVAQIKDTVGFHNGPKGRYPCQSFTGALQSLLAVGFELA